MRKLLRMTGFAAILLIAAMAAQPSGSMAAPEAKGPVVVGRVAYVEGQLLRYVYEEKDWVPVLQDVPFGLEDSLYSDQDTRAEIIFPNSTWVRIGGNTQIQAIALDADVTEVDVASGMARFYNRGSNGVIKATTPFGYVLAPAGAMFDLYVGDKSLEVIALKESVEFIHSLNDARYEVRTGPSSILADDRVVTNGRGLVDAEFDTWNGERDSLWAKRLEIKGDSVQFLPPELYDDAYELEENGRWERVEYQGEYRELWRPTMVDPEWAPYTNGRWTTYYGDQCWVPYEPFGYTTHHYGNWVFIDSCRCWYWAPPVVTPVAVARPWTVPYGWYPGRVSWIYSDTNIGWAPLAPYEPYYSNYYWGPASVAVATLNLATAAVNLATLHYLDHAVFVGHRDFWGVNNYRGHFVRNINRTTIINNYSGSAIVDRRVFRDFDSRRDRFNFVNRELLFKPHRSVVERIDYNQRLAARQERIEARALMREARRSERGRLDRRARIENPRVSNRLVATDRVDRPASEAGFQQRELKRQERRQRAVNQRVIRQQRREELQRQQQQERRQLREQRQQPRPERPDVEQRRQTREERQQQLQQRRQMRDERQQQQQQERQQQLHERRQRQQQQETERRRQQQQRQQERQQQQQERRQQEQQRQLRQQQQQQERQRQMQERQQRQQQLRQQQEIERQRQQQQRQQERQQQLQQRRQQEQQRQQPRSRRRQPGEEEQQQAIQPWQAR